MLSIESMKKNASDHFFVTDFVMLRNNSVISVYLKARTPSSLLIINFFTLPSLLLLVFLSELVFLILGLMSLSAGQGQPTYYSRPLSHNCLPPNKGGKYLQRSVVLGTTIYPFSKTQVSQALLNASGSIKYIAHAHVLKTDEEQLASERTDLIICQIPCVPLYQFVKKKILLDICSAHNLHHTERYTSEQLLSLVSNHVCEGCQPTYLVFKRKVRKVRIPSVHSKSNTIRDVIKSIKKKKSRSYGLSLTTSAYPQGFRYEPSTLHLDVPFPPKTLTCDEQSTIIQNWCSDFSASAIEEIGCKVCGQLVKKNESVPFQNVNFDDNLLTPSVWGKDDVTRKEQTHSYTTRQRKADDIVLLNNCRDICFTCREYLLAGETPPLSLANGLWVGDVPPQLQNLSFAEKMLIARVRHNRCIVRVSSGMHKMRANAIMFSTPVPKVYNILPPPKKDVSEVLACIFTGPCKPTPEDLKRIPLLVRRQAVADALEWLKLNHMDYYDLTISYTNLNQYNDNEPPVFVEYCVPDDENSNKEPEATAVNDADLEDGVESADCPFTVHGLTGDTYTSMSLKALTAAALLHLRNRGQVLAVGHAANPESIYNNPHLYPKMFPWLFPYGLGGCGNDKSLIAVNERSWVKHKLLYYDKRFQMDQYFPLISFNIIQIKQASLGGIILTKMKKFSQVAERILKLNLEVLQKIAERLRGGEHVIPKTDEEKNCYTVLSDVDYVSKNVSGSITNKKYMRNEIWSLIAFKGAPTWFITFAPADIKHPLCLYYAGEKLKFAPSFLNPDERYTLIAHNPVSGARFFHYVVNMFIKHVLGMDSQLPGLFGHTTAYYGTVEQQGRLTLHLHLLLWIENSLTPQEIRDKLQSNNSVFQSSIINYLESCHVGQFLTGTLDDVSARIALSQQQGNYTNPTETLPSAPLSRCENKCNTCEQCNTHNKWWDTFPHVVDDIVIKSNVHKCGSHCMVNKNNACRARFPRDIVPESFVDPLTGGITIRKNEAWINFFMPLLSYLLRCNSDVTSLLSGTAIKAVVAYVTEYITKVPLKTHVMFDTIRRIIVKKKDIVDDDSIEQSDKVRKLMTGIVNSLTVGMEIGAPMASLYLLEHPDHYTSHRYRPFYWKSYVSHCYSTVETNESVHAVDDKSLTSGDMRSDNKLMLMGTGNKIVGYSNMQDYIYRPHRFANVCLYDWIRLFEKVKSVRNKKKKTCESSQSEHENIKNKGEKIIVSQTSEEHDDEILTHTQKTSSNTNDTLTIKGVIYYTFQRSHVQYNTHVVRLLPDSDEFVPNFISPIPRSDRGDNNYYCATVLVLFKPWRSAEDLKLPEFTWQAAFDEFAFTPRQRNLMKYFNVRYECHDAKDDYRSLTKQNSQSSQLDILHSILGPSIDTNGISYEDDRFGDFTENTPDEVIFDEIGNLTLKRMDLADTMSDVLQRVGWCKNTGKNGEKSINNDDMSDEFNTPKKSSIEWNNIVKECKKQILLSRLSNIPNDTTLQFPNTRVSHTENEVKVISFLNQNCQLSEAETNIIATIKRDYTLNVEQDRAFSIIAHHSATNNPEHLKMHIGGMGGTGKSQVIKALIAYFKVKNQVYRFMVLAPTGTAAALVDGSTYHSVLAINDIDSSSFKKTEQIREKLVGVQYIFVDEVSMLSCHDMYVISKHLSLATGAQDIPFGGINVIFAGDFAQLPPIMAPALYDGATGVNKTAGSSLYKQECAIGRALWHQVTTVVILKQNMRQTIQSDKDRKFRKALENMRYKSCTQKDIDFLGTLIANDKNTLSHTKFLHVPVIVRYNIHRDVINSEGCRLFAERNNLQINSFYSLDRIAPVETVKKRGRPSNTKLRQLNPVMQRIIWDLPPTNTDHCASRLDLAVGMPVIIKKNLATECCITNGASGTVYAWQASKIRSNKNCLDVLFVHLTNPPKKVQIPGLPDNVVPITKQTFTVKCTLPDDTVVTVIRQQVPVLLNFGMTDYAAQGKTRPSNVCYLVDCASSQSIYTALSRSSAAKYTIIMQGFRPGVIQGGLSGYLRQEFRELEILNEITRHNYEQNISSNTHGCTRNSVIKNFFSTRDVGQPLKDVHDSINLSTDDPFVMQKKVEHTEWKILDKTYPESSKILVPHIKHTQNIDVKQHDTFVLDLPDSMKPFSSTASTQTRKPTDTILQVKQNENKKEYSKREPSVNVNPAKRTNAHVMPVDLHDSGDLHGPAKKKRKTVPNNIRPLGVKWDSNSCAFDAILAVLFNVWNEDKDKWKMHHSKFLTMGVRLHIQFSKISCKAVTFERFRNEIRCALAHKYSTVSLSGFNSLYDLLHIFLNSNKVVNKSVLSCINCPSFVKTQELKSLFIETPILNSFFSYFNKTDEYSTVPSVSVLSCESLINSCAHCIALFGHCRSCQRHPVSKVTFTRLPSLICMPIADSLNTSALPSSPPISIDEHISITDSCDRTATFSIRGLLYYGSSHYTCRYIDKARNVWFADGMRNNGRFIFEGPFTVLSINNLNCCRGATVTAVFYEIS